MKKLVILAALVACDRPVSPAVNVENASAVAQHDALLADCRKQGKAAKSYDVYETCADEVHSKFCREKGVLCEDGGAR